MDLEKLKEKKLSELTIPEMRKIVWSKEREENKKKDIRVRIFTKFSVYLTKLFLHLGISANMVSYLWIFLGVASTILLWSGQYWASISFLILFNLAAIIDHSDGEVARYWMWRKGKKEGSVTGLYLEDLSHFLIRISIFFGIGVGAWMRFDQIYYFYAGVVLTIVFSLDQVIKLRVYDSLIQSGKIKLINKARKEKTTPGKLKWLHSIFKPQYMQKSLFFWAIIFNVVHWFLIVTVILFVPLFFKNFYRELKRLEDVDKKNNLK
ncbi:CDP-alcohol phosphatidyltransferase family protein [Candidatus Pacearchaeota archaeon]|nr:CDP-alcohol phosphatidyltransferase family protein [Candidatus Pacearchaeota archaeon]